ncbi:D-alanyl-D-alanine carboxypeptidase [Bacillus sp. AGMB 02131]|uniref:serine-type D-Ala-D-Ala carboxypeptidase n=1 Tax=Peribacillus faecalis TaxID=2772559 RepID=A0A927HD10_9BACI|nr:D-alanyl-D-alanine carboxypeptidase family protein [Peribacillus faecalis]MBD3110197.1 D-alanyl-D-alanine carboxypeptidase [Peribacillus faecalis]
MHFNRKGAIILIFLLLFANSPQQTKAEIAEMNVSAVNAVLMEIESGRVLYEKEAHEKKKIASITKIMTALLAIESGKLDEMVTVSDQAFGTEGSSLYLKKGQKMKLEDLVYGLMLRSGNDAAVAIAEHVGGSLDGFVYLMNQKAEEIGMKNSSFTNPHGLDNTENHYSTAYDMALLTRYAMNNETFREISSTKEHHAPNPNEKWDYEWNNKNKMLKLYKYSTGGKTGYTKLAKRTLVSTAEKDGMALVAVTLNAGDDWNDHMSLFDAAFEEFTMTTILAPGNIKKIKHSFYKNKAEIIQELAYPLTEEEKDKVTLEMKLLKPKRDWKDTENVPEIVGKAIVKLDGETIGSRNIHYQPSEETSNMNFNESWQQTFMRIVGLGKDG